MRFAQKPTQWGPQLPRLRGDHAYSPKENTKVVSGGPFHREYPRAVTWLPRENPGVYSFSVTQRYITQAVYALKLPYSIDGAPLRPRKEISRADDIHEGPVTNPEQRNKPFRAKLEMDVVALRQAPKLFPPASCRKVSIPLIVHLKDI